MLCAIKLFLLTFKESLFTFDLFLFANFLFGTSLLFFLIIIKKKINDK